MAKCNQLTAVPFKGLTKRLCVPCSTPKSFLPSTSSINATHDSHLPVLQTTQANYTEPRQSEASAVGPVSYDFISNQAKKAFFESSASSSSPAVAAGMYRAGTGKQHAVFDRSDVDINMEAKINQYAVLISINPLSAGCFQVAAVGRVQCH